MFYLEFFFYQILCFILLICPITFSVAHHSSFSIDIFDIDVILLLRQLSGSHFILVTFQKASNEKASETIQLFALTRLYRKLQMWRFFSISTV